jgi:putative transposase
VQSIKGKTSRKLQQEFTELRRKYWWQHFWARGYFAVTVGNVNEEEVQRYIEEQELHHKAENFKISTF